MTTLMLLGAMTYTILGLVKLIQAGFVAEFNRTWARIFNDREVTVMDVVGLVIMMVVTLLWCWAVWPLVLERFERSQAEPRRSP